MMKRVGGFSKIVGLLLVTALFLGCTSAGGFDPNIGQRILGDLACVASLAGAYTEAKSAIPEQPNVGDVLNVINGATNSGTSAKVLNACAQMLANAGQDVGALQSKIKSKATLEKKPIPKLAPIPTRQGYLPDKHHLLDGDTFSFLGAARAAVVLRA